MIKRYFDIVISLAALVITLPILILICAMIRIFLGPEVIFRQDRPGLNGKIFKIMKFRTMLPIESHLDLTDDQRITRLGLFLRSTSLDELPELINVLKGDMSLVGPRPLLVDYLSKYSDIEFSRHNVLPGITGLAQIRGRNNLSWRNKFRYDLFYVKKKSLLFDIKIIISTVFIVISRKGFNKQGDSKRFDT